MAIHGKNNTRSVRMSNIADSVEAATLTACDIICIKWRHSKHEAIFARCVYSQNSTNTTAKKRDPAARYKRYKIWNAKVDCLKTSF